MIELCVVRKTPAFVSGFSFFCGDFSGVGMGCISVMRWCGSGFCLTAEVSPSASYLEKHPKGPRGLAASLARLRRVPLLRRRSVGHPPSAIRHPWPGAAVACVRPAPKSRLAVSGLAWDKVQNRIKRKFRVLTQSPVGDVGGYDGSESGVSHDPSIPDPPNWPATPLLMVLLRAEFHAPACIHIKPAVFEIILWHSRYRRRTVRKAFFAAPK